MELLFFAVAFLASIVGAICGIGGGVVIKPVLDMMQMGTPDTINFLSGCTVLSMSLYSVSRALRAGDSKVEMATGTCLALGSAVGGVIGKEMFSAIRLALNGSPMVAGVQAIVLGIITLGTLLYTINKKRIRTHQITNRVLCLTIGAILGIMSSFLGIGGGPVNLVVLGFFFGMDTKTAAANSLYIILFSQIASLLATFLTASVPEFAWFALLLMVAGGIGGGIMGRQFNRKMDNKAVDKLFVFLMILIILICVYNSSRAFVG